MYADFKDELELTATGAFSRAAAVETLGWLRSSSHSLMVLARAAKRAERVADLFLVFDAGGSAEKLPSVR